APCEKAKNATKNSKKTTMAAPSANILSRPESNKKNEIETDNKHTMSPILPTVINVRRPYMSITLIASKVKTKFTTPTPTVDNSELSVPKPASSNTRGA